MMVGQEGLTREIMQRCDWDLYGKQPFTGLCPFIACQTSRSLWIQGVPLLPQRTLPRFSLTHSGQSIVAEKPFLQAIFTLVPRHGPSYLAAPQSPSVPWFCLWGLNIWSSSLMSHEGTQSFSHPLHGSADPSLPFQMTKRGWQVVVIFPKGLSMTYIFSSLG